MTTKIEYQIKRAKVNQKIKLQGLTNELEKELRIINITLNWL